MKAYKRSRATALHVLNLYTRWIWVEVKDKRVKCSLYRPGVAQRVGRSIALLFHDRGTRSGWVVSSTPRPHFTPGKDPVPILQEAGWAPGPVWTGGKSRPHRNSIPDRPARSQSLYRLNYTAHRWIWVFKLNTGKEPRYPISRMLRAPQKVSGHCGKE